MSSMQSSTASEEYLNRVKADLAAAHERIEQLESSHWRCFHCDETFLDAASAEKHFGKSCDAVAVCQMDASKIRKMEDDLRRYRQEDTDLHRQLLSMEANHFTALRREEEKGYARGIKDYADIETRLTRRAEEAERLEKLAHERVGELEAASLPANLTRLERPTPGGGGGAGPSGWPPSSGPASHDVAEEALGRAELDGVDRLRAHEAAA